MKKIKLHLFFILSLAFLSIGMAKLAPHDTEGTGPRYFLAIVKREAEIYKKSYLMYPKSISDLEKSLGRSRPSTDFFDKARGIFHTYEITENSANFFRARSFNNKGYPDYEITSGGLSDPVLITEETSKTD